MRILNVLIACEESQAECDAFRALGHNTFSCDIQPHKPKGHPEWHIHADITPFLHGQLDFTTQDGKTHHVDQWHLIIAHPPCTFLCKASAIHIWHPVTGSAWINGKYVECNVERLDKMEKARQFFLECLNAKAHYVAVENPVPMKIANLPRPNAFACPSWYGVKYTKKTCYWLKNLPPLFAQLENPKTKCYVKSSSGKYRSRTFRPLAEAIAKQWSDFIIKDLNTKQF